MLFLAFLLLALLGLLILAALLAFAAFALLLAVLLARTSRLIPSDIESQPPRPGHRITGAAPSRQPQLAPAL